MELPSFSLGKTQKHSCDLPKEAFLDQVAALGFKRCSFNIHPQVKQDMADSFEWPCCPSSTKASF